MGCALLKRTILLNQNVMWQLIGKTSLREKCQNAEFFLVRIFLYSNTGKHGPEKTLYSDTFHAVHSNHTHDSEPVKHLNKKIEYSYNCTIF